jgi:hypothetical protein
MRNVQRLCSVIILVSCALVTSSVVASASYTAIRPHQHFVGLVNGRHLNAIVHVACPGPALSNSGSVVGGQTMAVARVAKGNGDTGLFDGVYAWFVPAQVGVRPTSLHFRSYTRSMEIPTSIHVACAGAGVVEFSSCPYLAPCAYGWTPTYVHVRFVNIAA